MHPTPLLAAAALEPARGTRPRAVKRAPRRIPWARLLAATALAVVLGGLAYLREWPPYATVMSGSMSPTIDTGDVVLLQRLGRPARVGDIVVIHVPEQARTRYGYPSVVVHRVRTITPDGTVTTKGDARKEDDPFTVPLSALSARVVGRVPTAGRAFAFLSSPLGLLWLGVGGAMFLVMPLLDRRRAAAQREADGLRAQLEQITEELVELRSERLAERDALARQLAAMASAIAALPGQLTVAAAAPEPEPEPEPEGYPLEQLALALAPEPRGAAPADESEPQLAFLLDVERRPRFARPCEAQLELGLDTAAQPSAQLSLISLLPRAAPPPPPPPPPPGSPAPRTWDAPHVARVRRRSGGLAGRALGLAAQPRGRLAAGNGAPRW